MKGEALSYHDTISSVIRTGSFTAPLALCFTIKRCLCRAGTEFGETTCKKKGIEGSTVLQLTFRRKKVLKKVFKKVSQEKKYKKKYFSDLKNFGSRLRRSHVNHYKIPYITFLIDFDCFYRYYRCIARAGVKKGLYLRMRL